MDFALESQPDGKRIRIDPEKPLSLKVKTGSKPGGEIKVGIKNGKPYLDNCSSAHCLVNGGERAAAILNPGDYLQLGALQFRLVALDGEVEVVEPKVPEAPAAAPGGGGDSDRQRQQRRISASRLTSVDTQAPQSSGLLKRVSAAFSGRNERQRLEQLEAERRAALLEAGRRSLGDGSALGIPAKLMSQLQRGQAITIKASDLAGLAMWREDRQRLVRLDAEISALRQALGLGPDPEAVVLIAPHLRSDELLKVERAFATMDEVGTQNLDEMPDDGKPVKKKRG